MTDLGPESFVVPGVTGFWRAGDRPLESVPVEHYTAADLRFVPPPPIVADLAANHHWLPLADGRVLLGHKHLAIVGCIEQPSTPLTTDWVFVDPPARTESIGKSLTAALAATPVSSVDLSSLPEVEREQVAYWQPATVGELVFHRWD